MTMSPGTPFAGSNVDFVVMGLDSWDVVEVTFIEPSGQEAGWIGDDQYSRSWSTNYFLSDERGGTTLTRYGAQDQVGDWSVQIRIDDSLRIINYSYARFRLPRLVQVQLGVPLFGCRSDEAVIFFSDSVNFSVTVGMHQRLRFAADLLEERLGIRTEALPVIYMMGNQSDFDSAARASGKEPGWEAGFFRSHGELRGIFMQSDSQRTELYHTLPHEYIHFLMDEVLQGAELPAWLNEGLAGYYEFEVGMEGDLPGASYTRMLRSADRAREAANEGRLFSLPELESQREWNGRPRDVVSLQYAQSHMLVRYLTERYSDAAPRGSPGSSPPATLWATPWPRLPGHPTPISNRSSSNGSSHGTISPGIRPGHTFWPWRKWTPSSRTSVPSGQRPSGSGAAVSTASPQRRILQQCIGGQRPWLARSAPCNRPRLSPTCMKPRRPTSRSSRNG